MKPFHIEMLMVLQSHHIFKCRPLKSKLMPISPETTTAIGLFFISLDLREKFILIMVFITEDEIRAKQIIILKDTKKGLKYQGNYCIRFKVKVI